MLYYHKDLEDTDKHQKLYDPFRLKSNHIQISLHHEHKTSVSIAFQTGYSKHEHTLDVALVEYLHLVFSPNNVPIRPNPNPNQLVD